MAFVVAGLAHAPFAVAKRKRNAEPAPSEPVTSPAPAAAVAPPLFPEGLPVQTPDLPPGLANLSSQGCNACHFAVHDAWSESGHRNAAHSDVFEAAVVGAGDAPMCLSCHLPLTTQQPNIVTEYEGGPLTEAVLAPNTSWDATLYGEGVTCAACHVRDGHIVSTRPAPNAPHPVSVSKELEESESCASCHQLTWPGAEQPFYDTFGEWSRSAYAEAGIRCQDCHMAPVGGTATAGRFVAHADHLFSAQAGRGISVLVDVPAGPATRPATVNVSVLLQNTGAGHSFPTGSPFRWAALEIEIRDGKGDVVDAAVRWELRRAVSPDAPYDTLQDTRIEAGSERAYENSFELPVDAAAGLGEVHVRVVAVSPGDVRSTLVERVVPLRIR